MPRKIKYVKIEYPKYSKKVEVLVIEKPKSEALLKLEALFN